MSDAAARPPAVAGTPRLLLRAEGFAIFCVALALYHGLGAPWWLFVVLFLAPDLSFLGYLAGPRLGAACYNAAHVTLAPAVLGGAAALSGWMPGVWLGLIWAAHIGFDRALGYGLKYPTAFGDTHLGRIGRR